MTVSAVSDATFEQEVLQSTQPVLVDFWAEWCGPCKAMAPALDQVAQEMVDKIKIVKLDVDKNPTAMATYGVRAMPTLILFKDGKPVAQHVGALVQKVKLEAQIKAFLAVASKGTSGEARATTFKLANGMDVVVIPDTRAPTVSHVLCYRAGEADAPEGKAGVAVLLGHLMAKSIEKTAVGEFNKVEAGLDAIGYHQRIAKDQLRALMQAEADRMTDLRFTDDEMATERKVIIDRASEFNSTAFGRFAGQVNAAVSGTRANSPQEFADLSRENVMGFYTRHYAPNNAVLVVCGDVTPEEVKQLAEATYGKVAANPESGRRSRPPEPQHVAARRIIVNDRRVTGVLFKRSYRVPSYATAKPGEAVALELLARVVLVRLSNLFENKVPVRATYSGSAVVSGTMDIMLSVATEAGVDVLVEDIRSNGVSEVELASAKSALTPSDDVYSIDNAADLALRYFTAVAIGCTIEEIEGWPEQRAKVTVDDIKNVANAYLDPVRSVTGWLLPGPDAVAQDAPLAEAV